MFPQGPDRRTRTCVVLAFLFLFATIVPQAQVFDFDTDRVPMAELNGLMRFHTGDDPRWADPSFDDSQWPLIRSDRDWGQQGHEGYSGVAWYRFRVISPRETQELALYVPNVRSCYEVYVQGRLVGRVGKLPPHEEMFTGARQVFSLSNHVPKPDGSLMVAVRVWHSPRSAPFFGGGFNGAPRIGTLETIRDWQALQVKQRVWDLSANSLLGELEALAGLGAMFLFLVRRGEWAFFWFAVYELLNGIDGFLENLGTFYSIPSTSLEIAHDIVQHAGPICFLLFVFKILGSRMNAIYWIIVALYTFDAVLSAFGTLVGDFPFRFLAVGGFLANGLASFLLLVLLIQGARRRNIDAALLLISVGLWIGVQQVSGVAILLLVYGHPGLWSLVDWAKPRFQWPFPLSLENICDTVVDLSLFGILILRFARSRRDEERFKTELESARTVQQVLIPEEIPAIPGLTLECVYRPAGQVGGDFFQIIPVRENGALIVIGDVSGKGMPAAMTVSLLVGTLRTLAHYAQNPSEILRAMNQRMLARSKDGFTTCLVARIDADGKVTAANAGHLAPYVDGSEVSVKSGLPLGLLAGAEYEQTQFTLDLGQQLTLITDGVVEAQSKSRELFGFDRAAKLARERADRIAETAVQFGQQDDVTVVTVVRVGPAVAAPVNVIRLASSEV